MGGTVIGLDRLAGVFTGWDMLCRSAFEGILCGESISGKVPEHSNISFWAWMFGMSLVLKLFLWRKGVSCDASILKHVAFLTKGCPVRQYAPQLAAKWTYFGEKVLSATIQTLT